jgi:hypothetical protein
MEEIEKTHELIVRIVPAEDPNMYEASIEERGVETPHWTMSGPPQRYEEVVEEVVEALRRHLHDRR